MYYDFNVGDKVYKLRLNTRNTVALEKALGCNPLSIFGNGEELPTVTSMVTVLHSSLQQYQHGISINDAYDIFDRYLEDGNQLTDFVFVILEIFKVSGIIKTEVEEDNEIKN